MDWTHTAGETVCGALSNTTAQRKGKTLKIVVDADMDAFGLKPPGVG
jgi:hypothetical protein